MADALVQRLMQRVGRVEELVGDQRRRTIELRAAGDTPAADHAAETLTVFEETLAAAQQLLADARRQRGVSSDAAG